MQRTVFKWKDAISGFPVSQGSAEPLDRWGGKTKHRLISHFLSNTFAKNYRNWIMYVKIIASQKWDVFGQCTIKRSPKNSFCNSASKCYFFFNWNIPNTRSINQTNLGLQ